MRTANPPTPRLSIYSEHDVDEERQESAEPESNEPKPSRRGRLVAVALAMLAAAGIAAICLARGMKGPFGPQPGPSNVGFWVVVGMGVGVGFRIAMKAMERFAKSAQSTAE